MRLKQLFADDNAVSPVIGVILMVAITVILAAVIASFVLGLGNQAQQGAPTATIGMDYSQAIENESNANAGILKVSHDGGDSIDYQELYIRGSGFNDSSADVRDAAGESVIHHNGTDGEQWNGTISGDNDQIVSGDRAIVSVNSNYEISVVYQAQEGDTSSTLNDQSGPDA